MLIISYIMQYDVHNHMCDSVHSPLVPCFPSHAFTTEAFPLSAAVASLCSAVAQEDARPATRSADRTMGTREPGLGGVRDWMLGKSKRWT